MLLWIIQGHFPVAAITAVVGTAVIAAIWRSHDLPTDETLTAHGTARWASRRDLKRAGLLGTAGLIIGRAYTLFGAGPLLRLRSDRHLLTVAPNRSGKGVGTIIPNLLTWPGSVLVIDPKGENARATAQVRAAMGQSVYVLDPWGITGLPRARLNPLDMLDPDSLDLADDAALVADALVPSQAGGGADAFWENEARALIAGLVLHVVTGEPAERRTLAHLRHLLTLPADQLISLLKHMSESAGAGGLVARAAHRLLQKPDRERSGVVSSAQAHTHMLDSARLAAAMAASDFTFEDLKRRPATIYLVLPTERLGSYARWLRLMVGLALAAMARTPARTKLPVLFLLDEFAALGRLEMVETAIGLMAGYGVQLWPIVQDLGQLKAIYGERWTSFIANAGAVQAFGFNDSFTAEIIAELLGTRTAHVQALGRSHTMRGENRSANISAIERPLLFPAELLRLPDRDQVLLIHGRPPVRAKLIRWYADGFFQGIVKRLDGFPR